MKKPRPGTSDMNKPYPMPTVMPGKPRPAGGTYKPVYGKPMPADNMAAKKEALRRMRGNK